MHQITGSTAVNNHFVDGSPTQGGTVVSADWLNTVQDEICNLIQSTGIALNDPSNDDKKQLIAAIGVLIASAIKAALTSYVTQTDFSALVTRVAWCEQEIHKIEGNKK